MAWSNVRSRQTGTIHARRTKDRTYCGLNPYNKAILMVKRKSHKTQDVTCGACKDALNRTRS